MTMLVSTILVLLLAKGALSSMLQRDRGCKRWKPSEQKQNVCCEECHPGNHVVFHCGPNPEQLCTPCREGTYTKNAKDIKCERCTQCTGAQIELEKCTTTRDTQCGCKDGLKCGDAQCSFCIKKCNKGEEPDEDRDCRTCPNGTFNDQIHQKCKPWRTKCPNPYQTIVIKGDAFTDNLCVNISSSGLKQPAVYSEKRKRKAKAEITKRPIIRTATDDPETLIASECSFHEAQEEHGSSSSECLPSRESGDHLLV
ncbi:tumor necrosis factor receptor superfamily member 9a isoform X2 [Corythoichthys intestinalis]|uniref:tumor necrosis factor receptor superfamily member 9a isoform X2 n=1 Tax=Corythoichthys intestinalis TaxID=161448 RepID=UPI0025A4DE3B|nr:tumor necrosis factor receptor superfamily member 9a isoform X2 [Corythoichthys intestinalis]